MKPKTKNTLSLATLFIIIALALYYITKNIESFKTLKVENPLLLISLIIGFLIGYIFVALTTLVLLKPFNVKLSMSEGYALSIITGFYNLITPFKGGMAARAIYLKKKHRFPYTDFLATLAASYVLIFLTASVLGLLATYFIYSQTQTLNLIIPLIFFGTFIGMISIMFFPKLPVSKSSFLNKFIKVINGWHLIKKNGRIILSVTLFSFLQIIISTIMLYLQFKVFGISVSFPAALFITSISSLGILIAITPANLGIQEAIVVFSALTIGITPAESLSAALLGRAIQMLVLFILGPIFSYTLLKKKPSQIMTNDNV